MYTHARNAAKHTRTSSSSASTIPDCRDGRALVGVRGFVFSASTISARRKETDSLRKRPRYDVRTAKQAQKEAPCDLTATATADVRTGAARGERLKARQQRAQATLGKGYAYELPKA